MPPRTRGLHLALTALALGCGDVVTVGVHAPTYHDDVAPLLADQCVGCHRPGGTSPDLSTYEAAAVAAPGVQAAVADGSMPPFARFDEACAPLALGRPLDARDAQMLGAWIAGGLLVGEPRPAPPARPLAYEVRADEVRYTEPYAVPRGSSTRCFALDPVEIEAVGVAGASLVASEPGVVAWALLSHATDDADTLARVTAEDGEPGFDCEDLAWPVVGIRRLAVWAAGEPVVRHPDGVATGLRPGVPLLLRVHFEAEAEAVVGLEVGVELTDSAEVLGEILTHEWARELTARAGEEEGVVRMSARLLQQANVALRVHAIAPGLRGPRLREMRIDRPLADRCLFGADVAGDRGWYALDAPVRLEAQELMQVSCAYDSRVPVAVGTGATDEPCTAFYLTSLWL